MSARGWLLPAYALVCIIASAVWCIAAFQALGGYTHATGGARILIFGIAGLAVFGVFGTIVVVALLESAIYLSRIIIVAAVLQARAAHDRPHSDTANPGADTQPIA